MLCMTDYLSPSLEILPQFGNRDGYEFDERPEDLIGAQIINIGSPADPGRLEGGGLVIDYKPAGSDQVKRLVLAFNELGIWIKHVGFIGI